MRVINASNHTGNPEGNSNYWVTEVAATCYQVNSFIIFASFKTIYTPLTYSPVHCMSLVSVCIKICFLALWRTILRFR